MLLLVLATFTVNAAVAQEAPQAKVTPLLSKELKESPGREGLMLAVEYIRRADQIQSTGITRTASGLSCHSRRLPGECLIAAHNPAAAAGQLKIRLLHERR
jgi:hypothetical protein